ncbi:MAG: carboxylate--amine ligase [Bacteroidota bacterium]|nr:carboxylate--amine ligase [Bacteroidota bacterium]
MKKSDIKVLLLDAANQNTLAILRHLGKKGYVVDVCGYQKMSLALFSKYVNNKFIIAEPQANEAGFIADVTKLLKEGSYNLLMPVGFKSYKACAKHQAEIKKYTNMVITSDDNISLASDKRRTNDFAERVGVPVPKTFALKSKAELDGLQLSFPCVIKGPFEAGKNIVEYAQNREELKSKFTAMCAKNGFTEPDLPIVQEYIVGDGYGFFAYYDEGVCKRIFMHHRLREYPVTGGASVCAESFRDEKLKEYGTKMLDALKWNGVAMVEFKKNNADGEYKLMEINPKFWGSLQLALESGVEFDEMLLQKAMGRDISYSEEFEPTTFQWMINGEFFHAIERPSAIPKIVSTMFYSKKDLNFSDPMPHLFQLANIFTHYYKKLKG